MAMNLCATSFAAVGDVGARRSVRARRHVSTARATDGVSKP